MPSLLNDTESLGLYWERMEPLYQVLRLMGYMPYKKLNQKRIIKSSYSTVWGIFSCVVQVVLVIVSDKMHVESPYYWDSYDKVLETILRLILTNMMFSFILIWWQMSKIINFVNSWWIFTNNLEKLKSTPIACFRAKTLHIVILLLGVFVMFAVVLDQMFFRESFDYFLIITYFVTVFFAGLNTLFWVANCIFIIQMARSLRRNFVISLESGADPCIVELYRLLWLQLGNKANELTESLSLTLVVQLAINHLGLILNTYAWMSSLIFTDDINRTVGLITPQIWTCATLLLLCEFSNSVTQEVGQKLLAKLCSLKTSLYPQTVDEIDLFIATVEVNSSEIVLLGCINLNRGLVVAMVSTTITYIIVLMQFDLKS